MGKRSGYSQVWCFFLKTMCCTHFLKDFHLLIFLEILCFLLLFSAETSSKEAECSGNSKKLASIMLNKNTSAQEQRTSSNEVRRMPPDLPGLKLSR